MYSLRSQFHRSNIVLFSLLILFFMTAAPDRQWAKAPAAAQCPTITLTPFTLPNATTDASYSQNITASGGKGSYTYSIFGGALPPGLTLTPSTGRISGTPTTTGNYTFTVRALDSNACPGARSYGIQVVCPTITLNPASLPDGSPGMAYSRNLSASGGQAPYTYSLILGTLPPGLSLSATGAISGFTTTAGSYSFTVRARDANNCFGSRVYTIAVIACKTITIPLSSFGATVNQPYSNTISASGGTAPYTFSLGPPSGIPPGLTLSPAGVLSGTPTVAGSFSFGVRATDANGCIGSKTITANICPTITFAPPGILTGRVGLAYSWSFHATGGQLPYTYSIISGALPPGLALSPGEITGTPTTEGSYTFTLRATDANGCRGERQYTLLVGCPTITIDPTTLPAGTTGAAYNRTLTATGGVGSYSFTISSGTLPPGLSLASNGNLTGAPTAPGNYNFNVRATDANGCFSQRAYTLTISGCGIITINPATLPVAQVGLPYARTFSATGGTAPYLFGTNISALPPGLSFNTNGTLSGAPTTAGSYSFIVRGNDANGCFGERSYTLVINPACPIITVNPATLPVGQVGLSYNQSLSATGGTAPYVFSITSGALPPALSWINGRLTGTPITAGSYNFGVRATDANGCTGERNYTLVVNNPTCPAITVNPTFLPLPRVGNAYNQTLSATGGTTPYTFSIASGALTPGLSLSSTGNLTGTPTTAGSYSFTVRATDTNGCGGERAYTQNVLPCEGITISPTGTGVPSGRVGNPHNLTFTGSGGTAPYTFSLGNFSFLPPGLTLSSAGSLTGTPTTGGNFSFLIVATSANGCVGQALIFLSINDPDCPDITISPSTLPAGTTGASYNQTFTASGGTGPYSFSFGTGAPPPGMSLSTNGNLTGTPTAAGNYGFTVRATDANGCAGVRGYTLVINNPTCPTITVNPTNATLPAGATGAAYNQTFSATGGAAPYSFSISLGALPPGLSLASNGNLTGTPATAGAYSFTVRATDANGCVGERTYTLTISACPTITLNPTSPLPSGRIATPYSQTITATGGAAPYTFSLATGSSLPAGLTLSSAGLLSGTPTVGGNFSFTIVATDAGGCIGFRLYNLFIDPCQLITVNPANSNLPNATISAPYSQTFSATGGAAPYTLSLIGNPPPLGVTFNAATGVLSGSPTQTGTFNFSVRAIDANGCVGVRAYTLFVSSTCPTITVMPADPNLPPATVGTPYTQTFSATGGAAPYRVDRFAGTPPPGLTLDFTTGVLSGAPTAPGTFTFTIGFKDAGQCPGERTYTLVINNPTCPSVTLNPTNPVLPPGTTGAAYRQTFSAMGGTAPYSFTISAGALPPGSSLSSEGELTNASLTTAGNYSFTVRATDTNGCRGERAYTLVVNNPACGSITVNPAGLSSGTVGTAYNQTIAATGGASPYNFSVSAGALPAGLTLNATTGALLGTPTTAGNYNFSVRVTDANGCMGERAFTLVIAVNVVTSVSAASFVANTALAVESIAAAFGSNMATSTEMASTLPLPTELAGVRLKVKDGAGAERPAPLFFVSPTQINYQIPPGTTLGVAGVTVTNGVDVTAAGAVEIVTVSPGMFSADASGQGVANAVALRLKANGALSYEPVAQYDAAQNRFVAVPIDLGPATDQLFLAFYGTGLKFRSALSAVNCSIGGVNNEVTYAGEVPGFVGLDQINARLSRTLAGRGEVDVVISVDGKIANTVRIAIR